MNIRFAKPSDSTRIVYLIRRLAQYEKSGLEVELTPEVFEKQMELPTPPFECLVAEVDEKIVAFALFFATYSTWTGAQGLHLEDMYVSPKHRGRGIARAFVAKLTEIAASRRYRRIEWSCLNWNDLANGFYRSIGAMPMEDWTKWRISLAD